MFEAKAVIDFWFHEIEPKKHWVKDPEFDQLIAQRFAKVHQAAGAGELFEWRQTAEGRLAEIIVLDQFSRNLFRDQAQAFAYDGMALLLSQEAIAVGADKELEKMKRHFLYMPFMHSESKVVHQEALKLFSQEGFDPEFEIKHKVIIDRFGRYPHRNKILGRDSTPEEIAFLQEPNSSF